jgi:hypothetical protein
MAIAGLHRIGGLACIHPNIHLRFLDKAGQVKTVSGRFSLVSKVDNDKSGQIKTFKNS